MGCPGPCWIWGEAVQGGNGAASSVSGVWKGEFTPRGTKETSGVRVSAWQRGGMGNRATNSAAGSGSGTGGDIARP